MKPLMLICLVLLGCAPVINVPPITVRIVRETAPTDTAWVGRQAVIIGTKSDSVIEWNRWVTAIKDSLWVDACRQQSMSVMSHRYFEEVEWSGDFRNYVRLEAMSYLQHLLPHIFAPDEKVDYGEQTHFYTWKRDPINGLWKRSYE